jgi:flavin reductase (DIM6/NTAB) family NADH-FMN oxidoreductase RutF
VAELPQLKQGGAAVTVDPSKVELAPSIGHCYSWPFVLVTCADEQAKPNIIAIAASSGCSADPPTIGIAVAPARYSHGLIATRKEFGVNIPTQSCLAKADLCGCVSGRDTDKFASAGFTALPGLVISVPLIAECPVNLECRLVHTAHLGSHDWFIGQVVAVRADERVVTAEGRVDPERVEGVFSWWGRYCAPGAPLEGWGFSQQR